MCLYSRISKVAFKNLIIFDTTSNFLVSTITVLGQKYIGCHFIPQSSPFICTLNLYDQVFLLEKLIRCCRDFLTALLRGKWTEA